MDSILTSIKKLLGIAEDYKHFDADIIMHINGVFMILNQLGVGPTNVFSIMDEKSTWNDFLPDNTNLEAVKTYVYLKVRLIFDPPTSGIVTESMNKMVSECEWRLNVAAQSSPLKNGEEK